MNYNTVKDMAIQLNYDDKLRLASLMIQMAMTQNSLGKNKDAQASNTQSSAESADYHYCLERVLKTKPNKRPALQNFLEAIFNFRGGGAVDISNIIERLEANKVIRLEGDSVHYL